MADDDASIEEDAPTKSSKKGLIVGLLLALCGGGGAFFAVYSGILLGTGEPVIESESVVEKTAAATFVPINPLVISLGRSSQHQLRFQAQLEVNSEAKASVENVMPRIVDVLNGYLRAVDIDELKNPESLFLLRGQMLRRIELVTGEGHVTDLLITEFVLS